LSTAMTTSGVTKAAYEGSTSVIFFCSFRNTAVSLRILANPDFSPPPSQASDACALTGRRLRFLSALAWSAGVPPSRPASSLAFALSGPQADLSLTNEVCCLAMTPAKALRKSGWSLTKALVATQAEKVGAPFSATSSR
jgi:hypothetical protein